MAIRPVGPKDAKIAIVGEAPGSAEMRAGKPFMGTSGRLLDQMLFRAGIQRSECYITNVLLTNAGGGFASMYAKGGIPKPSLEAARERLRAELAEVQPNVIIALGAEALKAITGNDTMKIGDWRGSILDATPYGGKVIATYEPARIFRQWSWYPICILDLRKAKEESEYRELRLKHRELITKPSLPEVKDFLEMCSEYEYLSFDIETIQRDGRTHIDCVGFAPQDDLAMCVPLSYTSGEPYWSVEDEAEVWRMMASLLKNPNVKKIGQNAQYDILHLNRDGVPVANLWLDTMNAAHTCHPEFPKGLDFLTSVYTREPFFKDQIRENRWKYNAMDAAITYEIAFQLVKELDSLGVTDFYFDHIHPMIQIFIDIQQRGVLIDQSKLEDAKKEIDAQIEEMQKAVDAVVGRPLNVNSPKQMAEYLYEELKLPPKLNRKTGRPTANAQALKQLYARTQRGELRLILDLRAKRSLRSRLNTPFDADGRMRTSYNLTGTETGRLSSSASVDGTGTNLQNVPSGIAREIFIPDPGKVMIGADSSQAEARVVAWLAREEGLIEVFESGQSIHRINTERIFGIPADEVDTDSEEYRLAKMAIHASNYGMGVNTFALQAEIPVRQARQVLEWYHARYPRIRQWHEEIRQEIRRTRRLETPFGRRRYFNGRMDDPLFREAYAFIPQSTIADLLHRAVRMIYAQLPEGAHILLQVHDAVVVQCDEKDSEQVQAIIKTELEREIIINGRTLSIPAEVKVGYNWNEV